VAYAKRIEENHDARFGNQVGKSSASSRLLGTFEQGDVVSATVRVKSDALVSGQMFLGDPNESRVQPGGVVVPASAFAAHAGDQAVKCQQRGVLVAGVLAASIGMNDQSRRACG